MITDKQRAVLYELARRTRRWALRHGGGLSHGMCGESSAVFCRRFKSRKEHDSLFKGLVCRFHEGHFQTENGQEGHCWVEINHELIIDVTADQFNYKTSPQMPPIVFTSSNEISERYISEESESGLSRRIYYGCYKKRTERFL